MNSSALDYHWYAVYTLGRKEKVVFSELVEDGYEAYLPLRKVKKRWSDRTKLIDEPLFPSYVFVRVSQREYYKVLSHRAILKYISFGGRPCIIPERQIEAVKRLMGENLDFEVTSDHFKPGQEVEITAGPMIGCQAEVVRHAGKKGLLLRVGNIGYSLVVNIPAAYLQLVTT
ncbi:MAG: UpxY family transcription antiterminator [Bacteroidales bacterium]|nr:UpxY family transcription antiterminator [Bacteroidales bacterium]